MKSSKSYRFSLSWGIETEEQILAGELLDKLGNKKSRFIVQLISEYIQNNPDVLDKDKTIKFVVDSNSKQLKDIIKDLIQAEIADGKIKSPHRPKIGTEDDNEANSIETLDTTGIADMFANLDAWNS